MLRSITLLFLCHTSLGFQFSRTRSMHMSIDKSPAEIIKIVGTGGDPIGKPWSYYDFTKHLGAKDIDGVSIITNNDKVSGLFAIDGTGAVRDSCGASPEAAATGDDLGASSSLAAVGTRLRGQGSEGLAPCR